MPERWVALEDGIIQLINSHTAPPKQSPPPSFETLHFNKSLEEYALATQSLEIPRAEFKQAPLTPEEQVMEAWEIMELFTAMKGLQTLVARKMGNVGTRVMAEVATAYEAGRKPGPEDKFQLDETSMLQVGLGNHSWHPAFDDGHFEEELVIARRALVEAFPKEPLVDKIKEKLNGTDDSDDIAFPVTQAAV